MDSLRQKQSLEERVSELEAQVAELQREMALLKAEEIDMQSFMSVGTYGPSCLFHEYGRRSWYCC